MKPAAQLHTLVGSRTWDKELVMWMGTEKDLQQALGAAKYSTLDLLDLFDLGSLPVDDESTRDQLRDRLRERLRAVQRGPDNRVILVVKSIGLLARYNVGLRLFTIGLSVILQWWSCSWTAAARKWTGRKKSAARAIGSSTIFPNPA